MNTVDTYRQDKNNFLLFFSFYIFTSFLAVCVLFGLYIWKSFDVGNVSATQYQEGYNNKQGVAGESITIN